MAQNTAAVVDIEIKPLEELPPADNEHSRPFVVDDVTYDSISYENFFKNHMRKNVPCIIKNVGAGWEASKKWVNNDKIDFDYLTNHYGNLTVPVTDCRNIRFDFQPRTEMKFSDYITYWKGDSRDKMLYLKDWHLRRCKPNDKFYTVPKLFGSDWLNEYAQDRGLDDFMFVYMGPSGTWTPMHVDVYHSFSWSVNVIGRKKWYLFPPGQEEKLRDTSKNIPLRFEPDKHKDKNVIYYEIVQGTGDAIFVPSGWLHQVENEVDTISINHNWVNGCNILNVWQALTRALDSVKKEIEDCKDFEDFPSVCQNILKSLHGMDFEAFSKFITHVGEKRVAQVEGGPNISFNKFTLGKNHCLYDLKCMEGIIKSMSEHSTYDKQDYTITENFIVLQDSLRYIF